MEIPYHACPVTYCLDRIGGKWKPLLLFLISHKINRFGLLQKEVPAISKQALATQLRELARDGLVTRTIYAEMPPRVEYALTARGGSLLEVVGAMKIWGEKEMQQNHSDGSQTEEAFLCATQEVK